MEKNFERALPGGYKLVKHINAKDIKFGIIFNLVGTLIAFAVIALGGILVILNENHGALAFWLLLAPAVFLSLIPALIYMVLHELVHGIAYKRLTGEKLTFGLSWSCAFCGVPKIYTYRRTALIAVLAPFVVFSLLFGILAAVLYFVSLPLYLILVILFGFHVGGCAGDLYVTALLLFKYKHPRTLMRDTGPEQFFYIPE